MAPRFPLFIDIEHQQCVVIGGGAVAARRTETFLRCGAKVKVVAESFSEPFAVILAEHSDRVELVDASYQESHLQGAHVVTAATDDSGVNAQIGAWCKLHHIPVSIADDPEHSSFFFPGLVTRGELSVGISTNGTSPAAARQVREIVEMVLPEDFGDRIAAVGRT